MDSRPQQSLFAGLLANPVTGHVGNNAFRRYMSTLASAATFGSHTDTAARQIMYQVGPAGKPSQILRAPADDARRLDASYRIPASVADDFGGLARKYTNFTADFGVASLAGMVSRLARALAVSSFYDIDGSHVRGTRPLSVISVASLASPVAASACSIFIPRLVDSVITPDVFSALVSAAIGEGGQVVTDVVDVDNNTRAAIVPELNCDTLPSACVDALRLLGANMAACEMGALFAYAFTRGIHTAVSVVAHSDEGGVTRDCLRASEFGVPYGGIHFGLGTYSGLPALGSAAAEGLAGYVDAIAIGTAALVAHCDPGQAVNGRFYPTVLDGTGPKEAIQRPGVGVTGTDDHGSRNLYQLRTVSGPFIRLYGPALAKAYGLTPGDLGPVERHFTTAVGIMSRTRHLAMPSIAPFYWVEPTSIIPAGYLGTEAEGAGAASLVGRGGTEHHPFFRGFVGQGEYTSTHTFATVGLPFARSSALLLHLNGHEQDGVGAIFPRQMDPNLIIHPGGECDLVELRDRHEAVKPLSDYLWIRGQAPLCAPGEFVNLGGTLGLEFRHAGVSEDGTVTLNHLPSPAALSSGTVAFTASPPTGISSGPLGEVDRKARRARTRAVIELHQVRARARLYGTAVGNPMPVMTSCPPLAPGPVGPPLEQVREGFLNDGNPIAPSPVFSRSRLPPRNEPDDIATGPTLPTVTHHGAAIGPQAGRPSTTPGGISTATPAPVENPPEATSAAPAKQGGPHQ